MTENGVIQSGELAGDDIDHGDLSPYAPHFVWTTWTLLVLAAVGYVAAYGSAIPRWEDWFHIPFLTGERKLTLRWLWEPMSEHRVPILKLVMYLDFRWFGINTRPVQFLNVALFSVLSALLIRCMRTLRGRAVYTDAFFPIILLNIGQGDGFLWAGTNVYVLTTFLVGVILVILIRSNSRLTPIPAAVIGCCLVLLTLCFGGGLIFAVCLSGWIGFRGWRQIRDRIHRSGGAVAIFVVCVTLTIAALYFVDYKITRTDTAATPIRPTLSAIIEVTLKFITMGLGMAANPPIWPISGWATIALLLFGLRCVIWSLRAKPSDRSRTFGVVWLLLSCLGVALVTGWGRVTCGTDYLFNSRYAASAAPTLLAVYCLCELSAPLAARSLGRMALFTVATSCFLLNVRSGAELAQKQEDQALAFQHDLHAGMSIPELASRHGPITYYYHEKLVHYLQLLRDGRYGEYAALPPDPIFQVEPLDLTPSSAQQVDWTGQGGHANGDLPFVVFDLKEPRFICGIKIHGSIRNAQGVSPYFRVHWRASEKETFAGSRSYKHFMLLGDGSEMEIPVYIYDTVKQLRIQPDKRPCDFKISSIELLIDPHHSVPPSQLAAE